MEYTIKSIGSIKVSEDKYSVHLHKAYIPGLKHTRGFSHLQVIWWAHLTDDPENRNQLIAKNLFKKAPAETGVFASRTPLRPNPVMISTIKVLHIDYSTGIITTPFIDAENNTPVIDIKPYFPVQRIKNCKTPEWYSHWPQWAEDSISFDWKNEISFSKI
jgi:tRNA (adenine37-N6)-methyltransferase